jgi:hypothetical protein
MLENEGIVNRVSKSPLKSYDLEEMLKARSVASFDVSQCLYHGMIIREKDFREFVRDYDWSQFLGQWVRVYCSTDAIIPMWAYLLIGTSLNGLAAGYAYGSEEDLEKIMLSELLKEEASHLAGAKVVVKGCSSLRASEHAFMEVSRCFGPVVASLMYGEPCSTVPIYKAPKR